MAKSYEILKAPMLDNTNKSITWNFKMRCKKYLSKLTSSKVSAYKQLSSNAKIHSGLMDFKFFGH